VAEEYVSGMSRMGDTVQGLWREATADRAVSRPDAPAFAGNARRRLGRSRLLSYLSVL